MGNGQSTVKESIFKKDVRRLSNQEADAKDINITLEQVKEKLKKANPEWKKSPNKLNDLAENLIDTDKLIIKYFSHLLERGDSAIKAVQEEQKYFQNVGYCNEATRAMSYKRMTDDIERLNKLEVKLLLYELTDQTLTQQLARYVHGHFHEFKFGPFHAAIQIGDVILEWGPTGLIIPVRIDGPLHEERPESRAPLFVGNVHEKSPTNDELGLSDIPIRGGAESTQQGFQKVIKNVKETTTGKEQLIRALAEVVVLFNTKFQYGLLSNNCHYFVLEVLNVLGVTDHKEAFKGKIKQHAEILTARDKKRKDIAEFNSHEQLDEYIQANIATLPPDDLEFAYCHYLLFHAWGKKLPKEKAWACDAEKCMCVRVHQQLEGQM